MKNIFKKTAGVMLAASMICAIMTTGCTASENSNDNNNNNNNNNSAVANTESQKEGVFTLKPGPYYGVDDLGITAETTNTNYRWLEIYDVMNHTVEGKITDENIKSMFNVYMDYKVNEPDENGVFEFSETQLDEAIKMSVPYDKGYYLLNYVDGVTYDVKTEYINGSYVFDTKNLGTFMFSTKSTGKTEPVKTESVELAQQTITDEATGVTVSGMLPVDAKMDVLLCFYGEQRIHPFSSYYLNNFEDNYPKHQDITTYVCSSEFERDVDADAGRIFTVIGEDGWTQYVGTGEDGKFELAITFIKDYEVLEFESDLTVTLPFDYREALVKGSRIGTASAMQYDYTKKEFVTLEVLPQDATQQGTYQFKAKAPGQFFIGDDIALNLLVKHYSADASERLAMMQ